MKFGAPHAVDLGQNNGGHSQVYIIGHGAETPESHQVRWRCGCACGGGGRIASPESKDARAQGGSKGRRRREEEEEEQGEWREGRDGPCANHAAAAPGSRQQTHWLPLPPPPPSSQPRAMRACVLQSWMQGDSVYMARTVTSPDPATINDASSWEFYAGGTGPSATWAPTVADAKPLFVWPGRTGVVTMSYHPTIQKYIMIVSTPTTGCSTVRLFGR